jgi:hypothetical protein
VAQEELLGVIVSAEALDGGGMDREVRLRAAESILICKTQVLGCGGEEQRLWSQHDEHRE